MSWKGVKWIGIGWTAFLVENIVLSEFRQELIENVFQGRVDRYRQGYSFLSALAMGSVGFGYLKYGRFQGPKLAQPIFAPSTSKLGKLVLLAIQGLGVAGLVHMYLPKLQVPITRELLFQCPIDYKNRSKVEGDQVVDGLFRITRHPMLWSLAFVTLPLALGTRYISHIVMFSGPSVMAIIGGWHQDRVRLANCRKSNSETNYHLQYLDQTSGFPGLAMISGKQDYKQLGQEIRWVNVGFGFMIPFVISAIM